MNSLPLDIIVISSGYLGVSSLGAMTLVNGLTTLIFIIPLSFSISMQFLIENSIIESIDLFENVSRTRLIYTLVLLAGFLDMLFIFLVGNNLPSDILSVYIYDSKMKDLAVEALVTYTYIIPVESL